MLRKLLYSFIILVTFTVQSQEITLTDEVKEQIIARVNEGFNKSISVAVINGDDVNYFSYGKTQDGGTAVDEHTIYEIGSISKTFTCILLAEEVLAGRMALSDPISKYLPETVKVPTRNDREITLLYLATHSSGLPRMPDNFAPANMKNPFADYSVQQIYDFLNTHELTRDIGERYEYSNYGMGLLGHILELHTGLSYEELLKERISSKLGMENTAITFTDNMRKHLAIGYDGEGKITDNWDIISLAGAGGIRSSTADMVKFIQANSTIEDSQLSKAIQLTHEVAYTNDSQNFKIGLAWHYAKNGEIVWHNGGTGGYKAFSGFIEGTDEGVVVLTNETQSVDDIGIKILNDDYELKMPEKVIYPPIVDVSEDVLAQYVGRYQLAPEFVIAIRREGEQLFLQATGQPEFEIYPKSKTEFFLKVVEASITFNTNETGQLISMTLHQNGQDMEAAKID